MKIGFFDSGLGGLTILKAVVKKLPQYDYLYYGDTANLPYGDKSEAEIYELTKQGIEYLFENDCVLIVIACNTASAETARRLQIEFLPLNYPNRKILGIIVPTIETLNFYKETKVVLLATKRTVDSLKYLIELEQKGNGCAKLQQLATPDLVPLIERNEMQQATTLAIEKITDEAGESEVIVLGCTHYTEIKQQLRNHFNDRQIISQDEVIPEKLKIYLTNHPEIEERLTQGSSRNIYLTVHRPDYDRIVGQLLGGVYLTDQ